MTNQIGREILFRVWDYTHGKMIYDVVPYLSPLGVTIPFKIEWVPDSEDEETCSPTCYPLPNCSDIMQYCGIKDGDKQVYEGDLVGDRYLGVVTFGRYELRDDGNLYNGWHLVYEDGSIAAFNHLEFRESVVGNVYENPDLLTKTQL